MKRFIVITLATVALIGGISQLHSTDRANTAVPPVPYSVVDMRLADGQVLQCDTEGHHFAVRSLQGVAYVGGVPSAYTVNPQSGVVVSMAALGHDTTKHGGVCH